VVGHLDEVGHGVSPDFAEASFRQVGAGFKAAIAPGCPADILAAAMSVRRQGLSGAALALLLAACGDADVAGPVRTALQASEIAQRELRAAGLDEQVIDAERLGDAWVVTTRWRETARAGHLVTVNAATGKVTVERYRSVELGPPR
jgi:hypothetical protein